MAAFCRWAGLLLVVLLWFVTTFISGIIAEFRDKDVSRGVFWWESREIYAGRSRPDQGKQFQHADWRFHFVRQVTLLMDLVGRLHMQRPDRTQPKFLRVVTQLTEPRDPEGRFCHSLIDYKWLHVSQAGTHFPQVRANSDEMAEFVRFCRREWHNLSQEEQRLLGEYRRTGQIPEDVLLRPPYNTFAMGLQARSSIEPYEEGERLTEEQLVRMINVSIMSSTWVSDGPNPKIHPWMEKEAHQAVGEMMEYYKKLNLRSVPTIPSDWKEVGKAIREGKIRIFDASSMLPREYFNISIKTLADREERGGERLVTLFNGCTPRSLMDFAGLNEEIVQSKGKVPWNLASSEAVSFDASLLNHEQQYELWRRSGMSIRHDYCHQGYINNRRLKNFYAKLPDMVKELGLEDDILRDEGYMWMGPIRGGFHYDEEANIYVQLAGESDVFLIPQSHVDVFTFGSRFKNLPSRQEVLNDPVMREVPFHLFRLMPGDAVVFPGRTFHLFLAETYNRLAVNFFFLPKWRKMEYTKHDWYSMEVSEPLGPERLALRQLWARTFVSMYEETGTAIVYMGEKNEYI